MKAVIFDMDGVLVNSEGLWAMAEKEVFSALGVKMDEDSCLQTRSMTTQEVTQFWHSKYPWEDVAFQEVEQRVVNRVIELIDSEDCGIEGIKATVEQLKSLGLKIGLATNAPYQIVPNVLTKLELTDLFDHSTSAELELRGKPHPDVYLTASKNLMELEKHCIAIEDSSSGIEAAKSAGMKVIGFSNKGQNTNLSAADYIIDQYMDINWKELINHLKG